MTGVGRRRRGWTGSQSRSLFAMSTTRSCPMMARRRAKSTSGSASSNVCEKVGVAVTLERASRAAIPRHLERPLPVAARATLTVTSRVRISAPGGRRRLVQLSARPPGSLVRFGVRVSDRERTFEWSLVPEARSSLPVPPAGYDCSSSPVAPRGEHRIENSSRSPSGDEVSCS